MLRAPARPAVAAGLLVLVLAVTSCSDESQDGDTLEHARDYASQDGAAIAEDARAAMAALTTVHVSGSIRQGENTIALDLSASRSGRCVGTIGIDDGSIELRSVGGRAWYRADDAFWRLELGAKAARISRAVRGRWVVLSGQLAALRSFCRIGSLVGQTLSGKATIRSTGAAMDGATPTALLSVARSGVTSTAYVRAAEPHHLLKVIRGTPAHNTGELDFSDFDARFQVAAPGRRDVFRPRPATK
ncbi:hypothetical protein [Nocardioides sp. KR10-350]|uniref:hypothetical protein n=1 Tax=Nocardioides cheoyonin TaxID=3156615 RepID=UPI0032B345D8